MEEDLKPTSDQGASNANVSLEAQPQQLKDDVRETLSRDIIDLKLEDAIGKSEEDADEINRKSKCISEDLEAALDGALLPETFRATKDATAMSKTAVMRKKVSFENFCQTESTIRGYRENKNDYMSTILKEESDPDVSDLHQFSAQTLREFHYQPSPVLNNVKMGKKQVTTNFNDHQDELNYEDNYSEMEWQKEEVPGESRVINKWIEEGELQKYDDFEKLEIKEPGSRKPLITPMSGFCQGGTYTQTVNCLSLHPDVSDEGYYQMTEIPEFKPTRIRSRIEMPGQWPEQGWTGYYQTIWPPNSPPCDAYLLDKSFELPPTRLTDPYSPLIDKHTPAVEKQLDHESLEFRKNQNSTQAGNYRIPDTKPPERRTNTKIVYELSGSEEEYNNIKFNSYKMGKDGIQVQPLVKGNNIQDSITSLIPDTKLPERRTNTKIVYELSGSQEEYNNIKFNSYKMGKDGNQVQPLVKGNNIQDSIASLIPDTKRPERRTNTKIVYQLPGSEEEYNNIKFCRSKMGKDGIQVQPLVEGNNIQDSFASLLSGVGEFLPFEYHENLEFRKYPKWSVVANEFFGDPHASARLFIGPTVSKSRLSSYSNLYQSDSVYHLTHHSHEESLDDLELDDLLSHYDENEFSLTMKSDLYPFPFHGLNSETDTITLGLLKEGLEHSSSMSTDNTTVANISPLTLTDSRSKKHRNKRTKRSTSRSHKREHIKIKCETAFVFNSFSGGNAFSLEDLEHLMKLAKEQGNEGTQSRGRKT